jgi:predicted DNA-binding transcriptional regulator AlpA
MSRFLTMTEASRHCGGVPSAETLYRLARDGHLPVRRIGRRLVISDRLLDEWIDSTGDVRKIGYPGTGLTGGVAGIHILEDDTSNDRSPVLDVTSVQPKDSPASRNGSDS